MATATHAGTKVAREAPIPAHAGDTVQPWQLSAALGAILLLEVALFCWSFGKFFTGDSLFYLWHRLDTPGAMLRSLVAPDHLNSYRPLTQILFSAIFFPLFKLNPLGYHAVALGTHLLTTVLAFRLMRQLVSSPAAVIAGTLVFGAHAVNFHTTYDFTFMPDFSSGLFYTASLLCYAGYARGGQRRRLAAAFGFFALALLCKEVSVTLPVAVCAIDMLARRRDGNGGARWWLPSLAALSFFAADILYIAWLLYIKSGSVYPTGPNEPYSLALEPRSLFLKLRYAAWMLNVPVLQLARRGWTAWAAFAAAVPFVLWLAWQLNRARRQALREFLICLVWAIAALSPVLLIRQVPMKHNLYMPLLACSVAVAIAVERNRPAGLLPPRAAWLAVGLAASTALNVAGDLKWSWVGQASDIARDSLDSVRRAYPVLPRYAMLYVLPTDVRGVTSWYFESGGLFNLFYRDPTLRMRFADLGHPLPANFVHHPALLMFNFHDGRLWDVTEDYKRERRDGSALLLLDRIPRQQSQSQRGDEGIFAEYGRQATRFRVRPVARNGRSRLSVVMQPRTDITIDLPVIAPGSVLQVGTTLSGDRIGGGHGEIIFVDQAGTQTVLYESALDAAEDARNWRDDEVDLSPLAGRRGKLVLQTGDGDWFAWSRLRIVDRGGPIYREYAAEIDRQAGTDGIRVLDYVSRASLRVNARDPQIGVRERGEHELVMPRGIDEGASGRFGVVLLPPARVTFPPLLVPANGVLQLWARNLGRAGDGVRGRAYIEDADGPELVFDETLTPRAPEWIKRDIPLHKWAGRRVSLVLQSSTGPSRESTGDWCAFAYLKIVAR